MSDKGDSVARAATIDHSRGGEVRAPSHNVEKHLQRKCTILMVNTSTRTNPDDNVKERRPVERRTHRGLFSLSL